MRCILVILDGIGDRDQGCFEGRTPLHAACTPNMDYLASIGMNGLYHSSWQGIPMSSEIAHFLIFGYEIEDFPGRGIIEAIGEGVDVENSDVALLCRLCSVEERNNNLILRHGRPELPHDQSLILKDEIKTFEEDGIRINLIHSRGIDGFLLLKGGVSGHITDSDPIYEGRAVIEVMPIVQKRMNDASRKTASVLNRYLIWCHQKLSSQRINKERMAANVLPVNALVTQRAGKKRRLAPFKEKWGLRGLSISSGAIYWGLCHELGMDTVRVRDTGSVEDDLKDRLRVAKDARDYEVPRCFMWVA